MIICIIFILMIIFINSNIKNSFSMNISNQGINFSSGNQSLEVDQSSIKNLRELNNFFYLKYNHVFIPINFVTEKNTLNNIIYIKDKKLILLLNPLIDNNNNLVIQIPRNILDSKTADNKDSNFTVLINNEATKFSELTDKKPLNNSSYTPNRELSIKFGKDTKVIEIEGVNLYKIKIENSINNNSEININFQKIFPILYGNNKKYLFYDIEGGSIKGINLKQQSLKNKTLNLFIDAYDSNGNLLIQIPRNILDSKTADNKDSNFTVLINNEATKFSELTDKKPLNNSSYTPNRELSIKFGKDTKVIEIEGVNLYKNTSHNTPKRILSHKPVSAILLEIPIISICIFIIIIILYKKKILNITKTFEIIKKSIKNRDQ